DAAASATLIWIVGNSAMRLLPPVTEPRVRRWLVAAVKTASAPAAAPTGGAARAGGGREKIGRGERRLAGNRGRRRRPGGGRGEGEQQEAVLRDQHIVEHERLAAGAGEADGVPRVVDRPVGARDQHERGLARPVLRPRRQAGGAEGPLRVVASAGERPAP